MNKVGIDEKGTKSLFLELDQSTLFKLLAGEEIKIQRGNANCYGEFELLVTIVKRIVAEDV